MSEQTSRVQEVLTTMAKAFTVAAESLAEVTRMGEEETYQAYEAPLDALGDVLAEAAPTVEEPPETQEPGAEPVEAICPYTPRTSGLPPIVSVPPLVKGGMIEQTAAFYGISPDEFVHERVLKTSERLLFKSPAGTQSWFKVIAPHMYGGNFGLKPAKVLVLGKHPNVEELDCMRNFGGTRGDLWKDLLHKWHFKLDEWMIASVCWVYPGDVKSVPAAYFKEFLHPLALTLNEVRPQFVLLFGADAMRQFWSLHDPVAARKMSFSNSRGTVMDGPGGCKVVTAIHPGNVLMDPTVTKDFVQDLRLFASVLDPVKVSPIVQKKYTIHEVDHEAQLRLMVDNLIAEGKTRFAIDCEWGNGDWTTGQLRTIQIAWSATEGMVVILRRCGMRPAFNPSIHSAFGPLSDLFNRPGVTVTGHNFRGDYKWLLSYGLDLTNQFINGGSDTMLMHHLRYEALEQQLELCALRVLGMERYDLELRKWLSSNGYTKDQKSEMGYGYVPDAVLHFYAGMDAVATWALDEALIPILKQWPGLWEHYQNVVHPAHLPLVEMEMNGVPADLDRIRDMSELVKERQAELLYELRQQIGWPNFNPRSSIHVGEFLFRIVPYKNGVPQKQAPGTVPDYKLTPIKTTDKTKGIAWEKVMQLSPDEQLKHSPCCDAETVAILAADCPALNKLREFKVVDQLAKNFLASEKTDEDTGDAEFEKGLGSWVGNDGRIHTTFRQTLETGRYATSPNLQNLPSRQEKSIQSAFRDRLGNLDPRYHPIRTCFTASPGHVLVEADWNQAELWSLGALAGDSDYLHVLDKSDIHTTMMQKMFASLPYQGKTINDFTIKELKDFSEADEYIKSLRTCSKSVVFGVNYDRSAGAVVREIKKEGVRDRTVEEAQSWIDTFFATYPKIAAYRERCKAEVQKPGYAVNPYGRYRRFPFTTDKSLINSYQRECLAFYPQSTVGDSMSVALINLWNYRRYIDTRASYRLLLSIHDAVLLEVPIDGLERVVTEVLPRCMVDGLEVPKLGLHYRIGSTKPQLRWGEKAKPEVLEEMGVVRHLCGFKE